MQLSFQAVREPEQNSSMFLLTRQVMVKHALVEHMIEDDDLAEVPEVMPLLFRFAGEFRDDIYRHHNSIGKQMQLPILSNCFCYAFAKGAESAYLWHLSRDGRIKFSYSREDALAGRAGAAVDETFALFITKGMQQLHNVFCGFQDEVILLASNQNREEGRWLADFIACGLYWSSAIGLDAALDHSGLLLR